MKNGFMKKGAVLLVAMLTAALCVFTWGQTRVGAEEAAGPKNYMTGKWETNVFAGKVDEKEEDGVKVTTYTPSAKQAWISPTMRVLGDVKKIAEGKDYVEVVFSFEISGEFEPGSEGVASCGVLIRAVNPRTNTYVYSGVDDWDGEGTTWEELYFLYSDGEPLFFIDGGGNCMANLEPQEIEIREGEWTYFESEPIFVASAALTDELFGDWLLCTHQITYEKGLTALKFRNEGIYSNDDLAPTAAPTAEPTEPPTEAPATQEPDEPGATAAPGNATDAPVKPGEATAMPADNKKAGLSTGALIGIIAGAAVVIAAVIVCCVAVAKKKKGK